MRILFLNPPFLPRYSRPQRSPAVTKSGTLYYPLWLAYAAGLAEKAGHEVLLLDAPADGLSHRQTLERVRDFSPQLAVIDAATPSIFNDIAFADSVKNTLPSCFVVVTGPHASALPEETLRLAGGIDAVARGEFDETILETAAVLETGTHAITSVAGLSLRSPDGIISTADRPSVRDLDTFPFVSAVYKKHLKIENYFFAASFYPEVQLLTARGCPFRCFFCLWPQTYAGRNYRARSAANVADEFWYVKNELPHVKAVVIEDDTFSVNKQRVMEVCEAIIARKAVVPWNANVRTDIDLETMKLMKRAGCYLLITGIESSSQSVLDNIGKGLSADNIRPFFDNAKRLGLLVHAAYMAGNPGETPETLAASFRTAKKYLPDTVQFFPLMPYPGTAAYAWAKEHGYLKLSSYRDYLTPDGLHNCVIELPGLSSADLAAWCNRSRRAFYLNPRYLSYKVLQTLRHPGQFMRTYKAFANFRKHILSLRK